MIRPIGALVAASLVVASVAGASAATAATPAPGTSALHRAAAVAHADASKALGGLALTAGVHNRARATGAGSGSVESINDTVPVKVKDKRYDIHAESVGTRAHPTVITLYLGSESAKVAVRSYVQVTVRRHGAKHDLLRVTTTFRRFLVMETALESDPLTASLKRFSGPSALTSTLTASLALTQSQTIRQYGAVLRYSQMSLDLEATLVAALLALENDPSLANFDGVPVTHTTAGSGGYAGSVRLTGTPTDFAVAATNTTDDSTLTATVTTSSITLTYTIDGTTYTLHASE